MATFIRSWWFLGLILLLAAGAIAGVVYGVTTHTEPGLMRTTPGFAAVSLPIEVSALAYVESDQAAHGAAIRAVSQAIETTNQRLGFEAYMLQPLPGTTPVRVVVGVPAEHAPPAGSVVVDPGGAAVFTPGSRRCEITTTNTGTDTLLALALQHELGHCLGLDHDCWAGSIMCGGGCCTLALSPDGSYPPRIDDSDRDLLRHLFGH